MQLGKITSKSQVTIPKEVAKAVNLQAGDHIEFKIIDGGILLKPVKVVPKDQAWFWNKEWQEAEREAEEDLKSGRYMEVSTVEGALLHLDSLKGKK